MGGDVPVDSETPVVTSSISRSDLPAHSSEGVHRDRVCVCAFIGVSVYACMCAYVLVLCFFKNNGVEVSPTAFFLKKSYS